MRTFITLEFNREVKNIIADVQKTVRECCTSGKFKYIDNFHLTLKFLGESNMGAVENIYKEMEEKISPLGPFSINLSGIGIFGSENKIKTVYIKSNGDIEMLKKVYNITDDISSKYGFAKENRFTPHITIAQDVILNIPYKELENKLNYTYCSNITFDRVVIMKSEQIINKRVYTPVKNIILKGVK